MGRHPVLSLAALAVLACEPAPPPPGAGGDPHAALACAQCHDGPLADRSPAAASDASCTASGCHADDVPATVTLATVRFTHLGHGATGSPEVGCAGCHTHSGGEEPLTAGSGTCGLCHEDAVSATRGEDCRLCHTTPDHLGMTSQGVQIPHRGLPWIEGGCLRCHWAVSEPVRQVSLTRCASCHQEVERATAAGIGEDLHPAHDGVACASCHEEDTHRIQAMSSAVDLDCMACHTTAHRLEVGGGDLSSATCGSCHARAHEGPQRLVLGIAEASAPAAPSQHFMDGLTCRSCHIPVDPGTDAARAGTEQACAGCHRPEYATVLRWWTQGLAERGRIVERYLQGAEGAVAHRGADDPARQAVARGRARLALVRGGGGQHNLPLAHRLFEEALSDGAEAYRSAGLGVPAPPGLGRAPRQGICAFCHYRMEEPGFSTTMDDAFHREVLGVR